MLIINSILVDICRYFTTNLDNMKLIKYFYLINIKIVEVNPSI